MHRNEMRLQTCKSLSLWPTSSRCDTGDVEAVMRNSEEKEETTNTVVQLEPAKRRADKGSLSVTNTAGLTGPDPVVDFVP